MDEKKGGETHRMGNTFLKKRGGGMDRWAINKLQLKLKFAKSSSPDTCVLSEKDTARNLELREETQRLGEVPRSVNNQRSVQP